MDKEQELLRKRNIDAFRKQRIPVSGYYELTPRCTFDCKMCYVHLTAEQMGGRKELTAAQWNRITDEAFDAGLLGVSLTGGECTIHPEFWEIYGHLREKGVAVTIFTNAYTLTDEDIERFRRLPPSAFRVTLYGASEAAYERVTGRRGFSRVVENIKKLRTVGCNVVIGLTLSNYNIDEFTEMLRVAKTLSAHVSYSLELIEPNEDTGRHRGEFGLSEKVVIVKTREIFEQQHEPIYSNEPITELPPLLPDEPPCKGMRCGSGRSSFMVHWDGRMSPCVRFQEGFRVTDIGFQAAWEQTKALAAEQLQPVECNSCRLLPVCHACAFDRQDPRNPGHADPKRCSMTVARYNAGLCTLKNGKPGI